MNAGTEFEEAFAGRSIRGSQREGRAQGGDRLAQVVSYRRDDGPTEYALYSKPAGSRPSEDQPMPYSSV